MIRTAMPSNLQCLYDHEEGLRREALDVVMQDNRLAMHLCVIEQAMDLADLLRQFPTDDEDLKVSQVLGMRIFNALGSSLKLALSGYGQNSAMIMRDVLETVFLLDHFSSDRALIERWRVADDKERRKAFSPASVRKALDDRDGFTERRREKMYRMFSELAAHPTMKSDRMLRPRQDGDAVSGPFIEPGTLAAVLFELGRLAVQVANVLVHFFPADWSDGDQVRVQYALTRNQWMKMFYSDQSN